MTALGTNPFITSFPDPIAAEQPQDNSPESSVFSRLAALGINSYEVTELDTIISKSRPLIEKRCTAALHNIIEGYCSQDLSMLPPFERERTAKEIEVLRGKPFRVAVVESTIPNAQIFIEERVSYVHLGLLRAALRNANPPTWDAVVHVVAHEVGHVLEEAMRLDAPENADTTANPLEARAEHHEMETECDRLGLHLMDLGGYNPKYANLGLIDLKQADISAKNIGFQSTHPDLYQRQLRLTEYVRNHKWENYHKAPNLITEDEKSEILSPTRLEGLLTVADRAPDTAGDTALIKCFHIARCFHIENSKDRSIKTQSLDWSYTDVPFPHSPTRKKQELCSKEISIPIDLLDLFEKYCAHKDPPVTPTTSTEENRWGIDFDDEKENTLPDGLTNRERVVKWGEARPEGPLTDAEVEWILKNSFSTLAIMTLFGNYQSQTLHGFLGNRDEAEQLREQLEVFYGSIEESITESVLSPTSKRLILDALHNIYDTKDVLKDASITDLEDALSELPSSAMVNLKHAGERRYDHGNYQQHFFSNLLTRITERAFDNLWGYSAKDESIKQSDTSKESFDRYVAVIRASCTRFGLRKAESHVQYLDPNEVSDEAKEKVAALIPHFQDLVSREADADLIFALNGFPPQIRGLILQDKIVFNYVVEGALSYFFPEFLIHKFASADTIIEKCKTVSDEDDLAAWITGLMSLVGGDPTSSIAREPFEILTPELRKKILDQLPAILDHVDSHTKSHIHNLGGNNENREKLKNLPFLLYIQDSLSEEEISKIQKIRKENIELSFDHREENQKTLDEIRSRMLFPFKTYLEAAKIHPDIVDPFNWRIKIGQDKKQEEALKETPLSLLKTEEIATLLSEIAVTLQKTSSGIMSDSHNLLTSYYLNVLGFKNPSPTAQHFNSSETGSLSIDGEKYEDPKVPWSAFDNDGKAFFRTMEEKDLLLVAAGGSEAYARSSVAELVIRANDAGNWSDEHLITLAQAASPKLTFRMVPSSEDHYPRMRDYIGVVINNRDYVYLSFFEARGTGFLSDMPAPEAMEWFRTHWKDPSPYRDVMLLKIFGDRVTDLGDVENQRSFLNEFRSKEKNYEMRLELLEREKQSFDSLEERIEFISELFPDPSPERDSLIEDAIQDNTVSLSRFEKIAPYLSTQSRRYQDKEATALGSIGTYIMSKSPEEKADITLWLYGVTPKPEVITTLEKQTHINADDLPHLIGHEFSRREMMRILFAGNQGLLAPDNKEPLMRVVEGLLGPSLSELPGDSLPLRNAKNFTKEVLNAILSLENIPKKMRVIQALTDCLSDSSTRESYAHVGAALLASYGIVGRKIAQIIASQDQVREALPELYDELSKIKRLTVPMTYTEAMVALSRNPKLQGKEVVIVKRLGSASIKGVFEITIDSVPYVAKIRRIDADKELELEEKDFETLSEMLRPSIATFFGIQHVPDLSGRIFTTIKEELELELEMERSEKYGIAVPSSSTRKVKFSTPRVAREFSNNEMIIEEKANGIPLSEYLASAFEETKDTLRDALHGMTLDQFFNQVVYTEFHVDLHDENILVNDESDILDVAIVDCALTGSFESERDLQLLKRLLLGGVPGISLVQTYTEIVADLMTEDAIIQHQTKISDGITRIASLPRAKRPGEFLNLLDSIPGCEVPDSFGRALLAASKGSYLFQFSARHWQRYIKYFGRSFYEQLTS